MDRRRTVISVIKSSAGRFPSTTKYKGARLLSDNKEYALIKSASYFNFTCPQNSTLNNYHFTVNEILLDEQAIDNIGGFSFR